MATTDVEPVFLDTNVLVYANVAESPFHPRALSAIETRYDSGIELWTSRQVLREFLATLTRPQSFASSTGRHRNRARALFRTTIPNRRR